MPSGPSSLTVVVGPKDAGSKSVSAQRLSGPATDQSTRPTTAASNSSSAASSATSSPTTPHTRARRIRIAEIQDSALATVRRVEEYLDTISQQRACSIDPDERWHTVWDLVMVALLCFVAIATPVEVAFFTSSEFQGGAVSSGYWIWNRVIDAFFIADMGLNFFLGFEDEIAGTIVYDIKVIASRYARTWFAVDLVSVLPFFLFDSETQVQLLEEDAAVSEDQLATLQIVRLARVLKIVRLLRASRILKRWEDRFSLRSTVLHPLKYIAVLIFVIHCMACVFELSSNLALGQRDVWEKTYLRNDADTGASTRYLSALYW